MKFLFAWRYFKAKKTTNAINIIAWFSILAIIIGTTALILVLSVFNGLEGLVKSLYTSFYADVRVGPTTGKQIRLTQSQIAAIAGTPGIKAYSLIAEDRALLQNPATGEDSTEDFQSVIFLKGVDDSYADVNPIEPHISQGSFNTGTADAPLLVLGAGIQSAVHVASDRNVRPLVLYMPRKGEVNLSDPFTSLSSETINTSGAFIIQQEFDNKYALTNLNFVRRMLGMDSNTYSALEIAVSKNISADDVAAKIKTILGKGYLVQNRYQQNASLYSVMNLEKWFIYAVLSMILIVAAFNMVGALTMLVLEKKADIAVLHALGASRSFIQGIFLSEGLLLGCIGGGIGMLLAYITGWLQIRYHLIPLRGSTFMIDYFPVKMVLSDFLLVGITVMTIAILASWIPARNAARQQFKMREDS